MSTQNKPNKKPEGQPYSQYYGLVKKPEGKPYSKYYGQGDPEWICPDCGRFIPDEQDELECLHCKAEMERPAPEPDKKELMIMRLQLEKLQRILEMAIGRLVPLPKIRQMLDQLSEPDDDLPPEKQ